MSVFRETYRETPQCAVLTSMQMRAYVYTYMCVVDVYDEVHPFLSAFLLRLVCEEELREILCGARGGRRRREERE